VALLAVELLETTGDDKLIRRFPGIEGPLECRIDDDRARVNSREEMKQR